MKRCWPNSIFSGDELAGSQGTERAKDIAQEQGCENQPPGSGPAKHLNGA